MSEPSMAPSSASSSSSSSLSSFSSSSSRATSSLPPSTYQTTHFTPIQENEREELEDENSELNACGRATPNVSGDREPHHPTPIHCSSTKSTGKKPPGFDAAAAGVDRAISCNKCRPGSREKISVVPLDNGSASWHSSALASPNGIFRSILSTLTWKSPKALHSSSTGREEQWKIAAAELSHKLIEATRKRDEALLEASRLKYSMAELENKLNKLEVYCHNLKSGLEVCSNNSPYHRHNTIKMNHAVAGNHDKVIENFLISVSESRSSVRLLSRSLTMQLRQMGGKVYERISQLLQPYDVKISISKNPRSLLFYLEALLNRAFFEDFESTGFQRNATNQILNPIDRCEANYASFKVLQGLTWEEVLNKGTRHFSEDFSRFCDRKMSEIVAMLGWNRAWPEPLLQAFFGASKTVWLVHLLATAVHPCLPIFRVEKCARFDSVYMEDMGGDKTRKLVPTVVRIMVAPGFYVYGNVVKCKVLCRYHSYTTNIDSTINVKGLISSP